MLEDMQKTNFNPSKHISNISSKSYYRNLILLRQTIEDSCRDYFKKAGAPKVDLYLISHSISSPIALGSDSKPVSFNLDNKSYFLTDSSQFGMEPLLMNSFEMVYCYLPSFRGDDPDNRHLNQFFHCESEMRGDYLKAISVAEGLIKAVTRSVIKDIELEKIHFSKIPNIYLFKNIVNNPFPRISFDEAVSLLEKNHLQELIKYEKYGRVLTSEAEKKITELVSNNKLPVWVMNYDRDTVAFYQKSLKEDKTKAINADLLVPSLTKFGFGGEVIGLGQRQDNADDIIESIRRQHIKNIRQYDWYIKLRKQKNYKETSGFGLGIERYLSWILGLNNLADACLYPVLKDVKTVY